MLKISIVRPCLHDGPMKFIEGYYSLSIISIMFLLDICAHIAVSRRGSEFLVQQKNL